MSKYMSIPLALDLETPALVYDEEEILQSLNLMKVLQSSTDLKFLLPLKACSTIHTLSFIEPYINGFSVSSLFEAKLARNLLQEKKLIHITTPGLRPKDVIHLAGFIDSISFNSIEQFSFYHKGMPSEISCGLRVNPEMSFVRDERYDPCKKQSKLGVPINRLSQICATNMDSVKHVKGLHFHTNCESDDFCEILATVRTIDAKLPKLLSKADWLNLGGGYYIEKSMNFDRLAESVDILKGKYDMEVCFEPGKGIVGRAGYIVASVVDMFENEGQTIAILDTTVNHMPEVFEYQYKPDVAQESEDGKYCYVLAGATCLAGDVFGEYRFDEPLEIGARVVFEDMGAYTLVKANMFNGINLPTIYAYTLDGKLEMKRQFTYEDFLSRCGANGNVPL